MLGKGMTKRRMTIKREKAAVLAIMGICGCMLAGCGDGPQTEEEFVVPREQAEDAPMQQGQPGDAAEGNVAAQVQVPERYQWEGGSDTISVTADAMIVVPDVEGIRTKKVSGRAFTQEDYDTVSKVLLGGAELWDRDAEAMAESHGFIASELENQIKLLEEQKEKGAEGDKPYAGKEETLDEQIAQYLELAKYAPEEPVIRNVPAVVAYDATLPEGAEGNWLSGLATADGKDYWVNLDNSLLTGEIRRAVFTVNNAEMGGSWNWMMTDFTKRDEYPDTVGVAEELAAKLEALQLQPENVTEEAKKKLTEMGMEEYVPCGGEYCYMNASTETEANLFKQVGYNVHCSRMEDGVPVIYTHEKGSMQEGASMWWPSEELNFVYTDEGFSSFEWINPWTVEDLSAEPVFLMPFAEIRDIFQEMILKKSLDDFSEEGDKTEIHVSGVRLGYARIQEPGETEMTGTLVPVWDFWGSKILRNASGEIKYVIANEYESLLTINAMDGTIVE